MANLQVVGVSEMYIKGVNSMKIDFTFKTKLTVAEKEALLDSSASENFIDMETWRNLGIR